MTITIGEHKLAIRKPDDLDAALLASTGCSAAEIGAQLGGASTPAHLARALHPHLGPDAPAVQDLAMMIAAGDLPEVSRQVGALYAPSSAAGPPRTKGRPASAKRSASPGKVVPAAPAPATPAPVEATGE